MAKVVCQLGDFSEFGETPEGMQKLTSCCLQIAKIFLFVTSQSFSPLDSFRGKKSLLERPFLFSMIFKKFFLQFQGFHDFIVFHENP